MSNMFAGIRPTKIRSLPVYKTFSNHQKIIFWVYYINEEKSKHAFLPELVRISKISKPTIYRCVDDLINMNFVKNDLEKVFKGRKSRGPKWSLKIELKDGSRSYAEALGKMLMTVH